MSEYSPRDILQHGLELHIGAYTERFEAGIHDHYMAGYDYQDPASPLVSWRLHTLPIHDPEYWIVPPHEQEVFDRIVGHAIRWSQASNQTGILAEQNSLFGEHGTIAARSFMDVPPNPKCPLLLPPFELEVTTSQADTQDIAPFMSTDLAALRENPLALDMIDRFMALTPEDRIIGDELTADKLNKLYLVYAEKMDELAHYFGQETAFPEETTDTQRYTFTFKLPQDYHAIIESNGQNRRMSMTVFRAGSFPGYDSRFENYPVAYFSIEKGDPDFGGLVKMEASLRHWGPNQDGEITSQRGETAPLHQKIIRDIFGQLCDQPHNAFAYRQSGEQIDPSFLYKDTYDPQIADVDFSYLPLQWREPEES